MNAANPYIPPRAAVADMTGEPVRYSEPKVWSASGRIGRLRYLAYQMVGYMVLVVGWMVLGVLAAVAQQPMLAGLALFVTGIPYLVLMAFCCIQRAHDMDWSGWSTLLLLIPLVAFVWMFKSGTPGENRFGAPPPPNTTGIKVSAWLIVILPAIIGILAAVSIPAYQQYVTRAKLLQEQKQEQAR